MNEIDRILRELRLAYDGDPWHGPSLKQILSEIEPGFGAARPLPEAHSVRELVLHMTAWMHEATRRLQGQMPGEPAEGDWPAESSVAAWVDMLDRLDTVRDELYAAVRAFPAERLDAVSGDTRDSPLGTGVTFYQLLLGVLQHDAYHAGQIRLLHKSRVSRAGL